MRRLIPRGFDSGAFAPYGIVIATEGRASESINAGTTQRFPDIAALDLRTPDRDPVLGIYVARARVFPLRIEKLERHRQAAQVFLPLGAQRFIVARPREAKEILKRRLALDEGFVAWVWKDLDYRLGLEQSLITTLEAEARWALREGHVAAGQAIPNYLRFVEPAPLRRAAPGEAPVLQ